MKPANKKARKSKGKAGQSGGATRRKADDSPSAPKSVNKRVKMEASPPDDTMDGEMDGDDDMIEDDVHPDGRKMTDEEKRKNFLERNRYDPK